MMDDSNSSTEISLREAAGGDMMEFTLEDTLGLLKDLKLTRDEELERIYDVQINNKYFTALNSTTNISEEKKKLILSFLSKISNDKPDDYPIPETLDMYAKVTTELTNEIKNLQECIENAEFKLKIKEENVSRLKERTKGIEKMKEACLISNKNIASKTYAQEIRVTNEIFQEVRAEMQQVVAELFPDDDHMKDFLAILCSAYFTSGDDVYVDLTPEILDVANFLLEAGLLVYHKYDKNKVRLVDL